MFNLKNLCLGILTISLITGSALAGPANKMLEDRLISSYLVLADLAKDGNEIAVSNKKTVYGFLSNEQKIFVDEIIATNLSNKNKI
jgi:hypothetical protein